MGNSSYADAAAFRAAAATGQVGVDPDAAQGVLNKIRTGKDEVEALLANAGALATQPKLGANPVGNAIAAKFSERADGGGDSYAQALQNLYTQYEQAEQAILTAMSRYHEIDEAGADPFRGQA
ncbi:hypothetical protein DI005_03440 [Prauserella sp. PE36]|uniref:PE domain-containing protein n=1 Tax=Prauserella endophytica TaxID=1592324 RepID=A0ABY2S5H6_9PSEU|nr:MULTISPECIES: hypothetical protein [Prauserella]PXY34269.1 hypothetical protein BAY59_01590 [Prauserella coralliicola]RBM23032.1 hypothetical protein DI005_03440 [Prauserella sp. PE36]TKG70041.1 hypothetical protein FCN18_18245 [Prauserella endophytica]